MEYVKGIFQRATIKGLSDYLLFGLQSDMNTKNYKYSSIENRLRLEKAIARCDKSERDELLKLSDEMAKETADVYMEIGLQAGMLLMVDILHNVSSGNLTESQKTEKIISIDYANLEEAVNCDEKYQKINSEVRKKIKDLDSLNLDKESWKIIDTVLSAVNERSAEYGRIAYQQGFKDALCLMEKPFSVL